MKKICLLFMVMWLVLCGCSNNSSENILKDVKNKINNSKSFIALGTMEISNDEETFSYNLESYYLIMNKLYLKIRKMSMLLLLP